MSPVRYAHLAIALACVFGLELPAVTCFAQAVVTIPDRAPTCSKCRVALTNRRELQLVDTLAITGEPRELVAFDDRLLLVDLQRRSQAYLFDRAGHFVRTVGRPGMGPGEFSNIRALAVRGDTGFIYDQNTGRETAILRSGELAGERQLDLYALESAFRTGRYLVINAAVHSSGRAGIALHRLDTDGHIDVSFREPDARLLPERPWELPHVMTHSSSGGFWSVARDTYRLTEWNLDGTPRQVVMREAEWFIPHMNRPIGTNEIPPPWIVGLRELARDTLIVFMLVPSARYQAVLGKKKETPNGLLYDVSNRQGLYDTLIEVLDLSGGSVVLRTRLDNYLVGFADAMLVYGYEIDGSGSPHVYVAELDIER
jgi:6-bladed beta-propeller